ncbi:MAG: histidine utilization repressor [Gammaproteobacteria bacterium]|nr:histidine utilization repressor [Gammaproteobacteria bacterium]MDH4255028.1 histidine utilization repressor [Gammaproteobacteria bacterium]MDH5309271.1 histidine utilization repressor [Gammaproteobacteria bacterium]
MRAKPRYQELKEMIVRQISSGRLKPHDRVPSENELVESAGVSRMTANRALRELTDEGYVERVAGLGTFVADPKAASHLLEVKSIAAEIESRGHRHTARVISLKKEPADADQARALDLARRTPVFRVLLVHFENGLPIQLEDRSILPEFAPEFLLQDFTLVTPSEYLSDIAPLQEAEHVVRATRAPAEVREALDMERDEPCLLVVRRTWARGRPVTYGRLYHPGSRFELTGHFAPPGVRPTAPQPGLEQKP